ncbi:unnamed protein product [Nesidiocoris tenuis]|uniref:Protein hunchback n=1 Tax=Nesidiocoris tenuis TaxID=355587 RepID=A0A6H5GIR1_9HEMI|nr:unnamed protein product [Nesidiocoris tenuis]
MGPFDSQFFFAAHVGRCYVRPHILETRHHKSVLRAGHQDKRPEQCTPECSFRDSVPCKFEQLPSAKPKPERQSKSRIKRPPKISRRLKCPQCYFTCATSPTLTKHLATHTGEKRFKCADCNYASRVASKLKRHMLQHTGEKPFSCSECSYACARPSSLKQHMMRHTGEKPFNCSQCDFACRNAFYLREHMLQHTGEKPYSCSECSYASHSSANLRTHKLKHTGEKPFRCSECTYASRFSRDLKEHMLLHAGEKPFSCSQCSYAGSRANALKRHMQTHTGERPFSCRNRARVTLTVCPIRTCPVISAMQICTLDRTRKTKMIVRCPCHPRRGITKTVQTPIRKGKERSKNGRQLLPRLWKDKMNTLGKTQAQAKTQTQTEIQTNTYSYPRKNERSRKRPLTSTLDCNSLLRHQIATPSPTYSCYRRLRMAIDT